MSDYYVDFDGKLKKKKKGQKQGISTTGDYSVDYNGNISQRERELDEELAPVKTTTKATDNSRLDFFSKGAYEDGKQKGDFINTVLGTAADAGINLVKGFGGMVEGVVDLAAYGVAGVAGAFGADRFANTLKEVTKESQLDYAFSFADDYVEQNSALGRTSDSIAQGIGQIAGIIATGSLGAAGGLGKVGTTVLTTGVTGASGMGSGMGEAYKEGATDEEAVTYGAIAGASDALTELMFGGLGKAVGAVGLSKGLSSADDVLAKKVSGVFKSQMAKNFAEYGIKAGAEGFEEVVAGTAQAIGKKITYMSEEELGEIIRDENLLEQFIVGAVTSGIAQSGYVPGMKDGSLKQANETGRDFITGFTQNEQAVIDKEVEKRIAEQEQEGKVLSQKEIGAIEKQVTEEIDKGYISIDTIEETLGGDTYKSYRETVDKEDAQIKELETQIKELEAAQNTVGNAKKYDALTAQLEDLKTNSQRDQLKQKLSEEVYGVAQGSRLAESYNEKARRSQKFEADLTKYDVKQQAVVQKAIDSGILNNTNRTHEFVDLIAKIAADKGVSFDFTNNAKLKESGFAIDGKFVNGYVTKDGVTLNIQSSKALNSVVGHEITHVLEGTELYTELQNAVKQYAESKGDYKARLDAITKLYEGVKDADVNAEITADLVGDYLFTDADFVRKLSVEHRNVFQKIYDEIKYLAKVATAGSKEARQLEKAKKVFADAYRADSKGVSGRKYALEMDMTETERYNELKDKTLYVVESADQTQYQEKLDNIDSLPPKAKSKAEGAIYELAEELGILRKSMTTPEIKFDFQISKNNGLKKSLSNQLDYGGSYGDFARALINLDKIVQNAVLVDAYTKDRYANTSRANARFEGGYVLLGAFQDSENIIPVKLTIKKEAGETGNLYVVVAMTKIKRTSVLGSEGTTPDGAEQPLPDTGSTYSLQQIISNVNTEDADFLKYLPDGLLSEEQINAKQKAIDKQNKKTAKYSLSGVKSNLDNKSQLALAEQMEADGKTSEDIRQSTGWFRSYDNQWRYEIDDSKAVWHLDTAKPNQERLFKFGEKVYRLEDLLDHKELYEAYPQLKDVTVFVNPYAPMDGYVIGRNTEHLTVRELEDSNFSKWTLIHELQHIIQNIEGFATGASKYEYSYKEWGEKEYEALEKRNEIATKLYAILRRHGESISKDAIYYNQHAPNVSDEIIESNYFELQSLGAQNKRTQDLIDAYYEQVQKLNATTPEGQYHATAGEIEAYDVQARMGMSADERKAMRPNIDREDAIVKFSLSNEGDIAPIFGNYNVRGEDIALAPVQDSVQDSVQDIAPVAKNAKTAADLPDDYAPITEAEANAQADENLATITDEDAPPVPEATEYDDFTDTTAIDPKALKDISKALKDVLYLDNKEVKAIGEVVQKYSTSEFPDKADLFDELQAKFGKKETVERNEETAAIKRMLRGYPINVSQEIKNDIADYGQFFKRNFGKIRFSKEGVPVDTAYQDLADMFPGYFPADITNATDQLLRISEVAGLEINETETFELSDGEIMEAVDAITAEVAKYKEAQVLAGAEADRRAAFAEIEDIGPVREDIAPAPAESVPAADPNQPIRTVKERLAAKLQNAQAELAQNKTLRAQANDDYNQEIARLYAEYNAKKNKTTQTANDILRRVERLKRIKGNVDADYAKRISDLEAKVAKASEEARTGESTTEQAAMRREVHTQIVDNIKTTFGESGYDFDKVLEGAKDLSTFATVDNTPQRVMEKSLGYKEGQILADLTVNKVAQNETAGIKWLSSFTDRKNGLLAKISKQYNIKPGSKESAAAQMYAEGFYVNDKEEIIQYGDAELAKDFPDAAVRANIKGLAKDERIRKIYDETLAAINKSRARNAYPEIQRLDNYFLHFRAQTDTFSRLGIPFNPNDIKAKDLPTDLNGVTADLKPGQPYFASAMHRKGKRTSFDLLGGLEQYLTGAKDQIYHIDDIQTLRALRNYIADNYGQGKGLDNLDALTEEEAEAKIKEVYNGHLSTFAKFLNEEANVIAGKTSLTDRGLEGVIGRRGIAFLDTVNRQVGSNMVGFNVSSSLTNFLSAVQGFAKVNKTAYVKALAQTASNKLGSIVGKSDGFAEQSPVIIRRKGADRYHRTPWQKAGDAGYVLMSAVDNISTEILARAKYNELTAKGMDAQQAHTETDKWVSRLMGDRSLGQQPQLYNSKMLGMVTKFQLEVRNQLDSQFYDTIQEANVSTEGLENGLKRNAAKAAKIGSTFFQLAVLQHVFGKAFESIAGYNPAFDIISVLIKTLGWDDEEDDEDTALDNLQEGFMELMGDLPYTSTFTGGRIPISSALPIEQLVTGKDDYGNEKSRLETIKETAPYYVLPGGYSQIKKTTQGLGMFDDDLPIAGSYTDSGNLRYPVEDTVGNRLQAAVFGQYASENARDYFDNERAPLKENQIQELIDTDLPIREYWDYREGLKDRDTVEEKVNYIAGLDLPIDTKNILVNNAVDRKDPIDLTGYDSYSDYEEFDFAVKKPGMYKFLKDNGVTVFEYLASDKDTKEAYTWAYNNPERYTMSKAIASDVAVYRQYARELNDITADRENGVPISGSRKDKVIEYINGLNADYGQKIILFKSEYEADDTYNAEIVEYLNSRSDISFDESVAILRELGFTVLADGTVRW